MKDQDIDKIITLALEKQNLIEKFLKLTKMQAEAINSNNYDSILDIINQKQNTMELINLIDLECLGKMPEDNEELGLINQNTREIMARAIAIDDKNIMSLKNNQAQIFTKLKDAKKNKMTHDLYRGKNISIEGILLDKKN
jgi:hypothetical protein